MITVTSIQGSSNAYTGTKIVTMLATYPRAVHAQFLTHKMLCKNSSSSRAIPTITEIQSITSNPALFKWAQNQKGMQGEIITDQTVLDTINAKVAKHRKAAFKLAKELADPKGLNVHKQNVNRFLEPFSNTTVLITATEWENFEWLRCDKDTQPEMDELANKLREAKNNTVYMPLYEEEYHVPFIDRMRDEDGVLRYYGAGTQVELSLAEALDISLSCAAQISYRKLDDSMEKAENIKQKLFGEKVHASPSEHQGTPICVDPNVLRDMPLGEALASLPKGVTHVDVNMALWSGPLKGFIQYRHLLPRTDKAKF